MQIWHYHPENGELIDTSDARESPLEPGVYHIPAYATSIKPLKAVSGLARVFDGEAWAQVEDNRGDVYSTVDGAQSIMTKLGELPEGYTKEPRPTLDHFFVDGAWQLDAAARNIRIAAEVRAKRDALIAQCDWVVTRAAETSKAVPPTWQIYRQALRDITMQEGFPHTVAWPETPEA